MSLFGKTDALASVPKDLEIGRIHGAYPIVGGSGYTDGASQAITFSAPETAGGVTATGTATVVGGVVTGITITNQGSGYVAAPTITGPAGGTGFTYGIVKQPTKYNPASIILVDDTEAAIESNKSKGLRSPGWWLFNEVVNSNGETSYKSELLVAFTSVTTATGDKEEDLAAADVLSVIAISAQPTEQTTVSGAATFSVTAAFSSGSGTLTYQWYKALAATPTKFTKINGQTAASLVLSGQLVANNGDKYRVVVAGGGAKAVTSDTANLVFGT